MSNAEQSAYPFHYDNSLGSTHQDGLTKRERFAMAAMQGIISHPKSHCYDGMSPYESTAHDAVQHADAILKELEESQ